MSAWPFSSEPAAPRPESARQPRYEPIPVTCSHCNGSGEGQREGSTCVSCGGKGIEWLREEE